MSKEGKTATVVLTENLAVVSTKIDNLNEKLETEMRMLRNEIALLKTNNEAIMAAISAGRKPAAPRSSSAKTTSPQGNKTYANQSTFFKDKYLDDEYRERYREFLDDDERTELDNEVGKSKKTGAALRAVEATAFYKMFVTKNKDGDAAVEKAKGVMEGRIKADFTAYKAENTQTKSTAGTKE